jgi:hypothetical protein
MIYKLGKILLIRTAKLLQRLDTDISKNAIDLKHNAPYSFHAVGVYLNGIIY